MSAGADSARSPERHRARASRREQGWTPSDCTASDGRSSVESRMWSSLRPLHHERHAEAVSTLMPIWSFC